jgi:hypothetical protein
MNGGSTWIIEVLFEHLYIAAANSTYLVPLLKVARRHARHSCPQREQVGMICCSLMICAPSFNVSSSVKAVFSP